jgi:hypothetical protein
LPPAHGCTCFDCFAERCQLATIERGSVLERQLPASREEKSISHALNCRLPPNDLGHDTRHDKIYRRHGPIGLITDEDISMDSSGTRPGLRKSSFLSRLDSDIDHIGLPPGPGPSFGGFLASSGRKTRAHATTETDRGDVFLRMSANLNSF